MRVPLPWEKGLKADIRRALFKRTLKKRARKLAHPNRETMFAVLLAVFSVFLLVRAGALIADRTATQAKS